MKRPVCSSAACGKQDRRPDGPASRTVPDCPQAGLKGGEGCPVTSKRHTESIQSAPAIPYGIQVQNDVTSCAYFNKIGHDVADCWKKQRDDWTDQVHCFWSKKDPAENDCSRKERKGVVRTDLKQPTHPSTRQGTHHAFRHLLATH